MNKSLSSLLAANARRRQRSRLAQGLIALLLWLALAPAFANNLDARVDRANIGEGETLQLILTASGNDGGDSPDLQPLRKDFDVLGTHQANRIQIINGRADSSREWRIVLAPKRRGTLTIPALRLGALRSKPLSVTVRDTASADGGKDREVMLEASVDTASPYVQAQVVLTLRLLHRVPLREAALGKLELGDAVVERLGDDVNFQVERNGQQYEGIERRYAIFPQRSGALTIPPVLLTAKVPDKRARGGDPVDPFGDPFNLLQPLLSVRVRSEEIVLKVRPPPASASASGAAWLPAADLTLEETWSTEPPVLRVGEPATRTLTLRAEGLTAAQLPVIEPSNWQGMKVYTDQPILQTEPGQRSIVGTSQLKWAVVPAQQGKITLPAVRVPWWDTKAGLLKTAVLPARTLEVLAAAADTPAPRASPADASMDAASAPTAAGMADDNLFQPWQLASVGLAALWLATLGLWLRERRRTTASAPRLSPNLQSRAVARATLRSACQRADLAACRDATLTVAATLWPEDTPGTLAAMAARVDDPARDALQDLEARLYGTRAGPWDAAAFYKALAPLLDTSHRRARKTQADPLADLADIEA